MKECNAETLETRSVDLLSPQSAECTFSFLLSISDKSAFVSFEFPYLGFIILACFLISPFSLEQKEAARDN